MFLLAFTARLALSAALAGTLPHIPTEQVDARLTLGSIYEHPAEAVGQELCFYVQFDGLEEEWNSFGTEFASETHLRARVWSDDQRLWDREQFQNPLGHVFFPAHTRAAARLQNTQRYQRLLCVGRVRSLRCGRPWIEVTRAYWSRQSLSEGSLLHAIRGEEMRARQALNLAKDEYNRALTPNLPKAIRSDLEARIEQCLGE
ncbi:MAG: hypothetical protein KDB61_07495 [Planctomycetes bacterium]|nr:hypothetical protein [Planctomycetota bacterium]